MVAPAARQLLRELKKKAESPMNDANRLVLDRAVLKSTRAGSRSAGRDEARRQVSDERWRSIALQVACDALFHLRRKRRHRSCDLVPVHPEHQFLEDRKGHPAPGFI